MMISTTSRRSSRTAACPAGVGQSVNFRPQCIGVNHMASGRILRFDLVRDKDGTIYVLEIMRVPSACLICWKTGSSPSGYSRNCLTSTRSASRRLRAAPFMTCSPRCRRVPASPDVEWSLPSIYNSAYLSDPISPSKWVWSWWKRDLEVSDDDCRGSVYAHLRWARAGRRHLSAY